MPKGLIYVMTTVVPGLVKIGKTGLENFEQRMSNLERNGYRNVSGLKRVFAISVDDYDEKEDLIDEIFSKSRVGDTELFSLDVNLVTQLLSSLEGTVVCPSESKKEVFEQATEAVQSSVLPDGYYDFKFKSKVNGQTYSAILCVNNGQLVLRKGSMIAPLSEGVSDDASWLPARNALKLKNEKTIEDVPCSSVSFAASIVAGHAMNGWTSWKDFSGNPINIYRKKALEESED